MNDLFLVLFLISGLGLLVGLIMPKVALGYLPETKRNRKSALKVYGIALLASFILFGLTSSPVKEDVEISKDVEEKEISAVKEEPIKKEPVKEDVVKEEPVKEEPAEEEIIEEEVSETMSQSQAVKKAESYIAYTSFSKSGLIEQLEFEGFSNEDATYAVDKIKVNWKEQAADKAKSYLDYTAFSRSGLIEQLQFEGFSSDQASYAADEVGL